MHLDADLRAEVARSETVSGSLRTALAYVALVVGATGTLAIVPAVVGLLAALGFQ